MIIFIGSSENIEELEPDDAMADSFPCMSTQQFGRDARAQLYSLVAGNFLDDAWSMEVLTRSLSEDGPYIYELDNNIVARLAELDEDDIGEFAELWLECGELESLDLEVNDLYEFMYQLVHFCRTAEAGDDLGVYVFSPDG